LYILKWNCCELKWDVRQIIDTNERLTEADGLETEPFLCPLSHFPLIAFSKRLRSQQSPYRRKESPCLFQKPPA